MEREQWNVSHDLKPNQLENMINKFTIISSFNHDTMLSPGLTCLECEHRFILLNNCTPSNEFTYINTSD